MNNMPQRSRPGDANLSKSKLSMQIKQIDFAIIETAEFLDTHPNNLKALRYYKKLKAEREKLLAEYESSVGPMTMHGNEDADSWAWIKGPWPWEGER